MVFLLSRRVSDLGKPRLDSLAQTLELGDLHDRRLASDDHQPPSTGGRVSVAGSRARHGNLATTTAAESRSRSGARTVAVGQITPDAKTL